MAYFLRKEKKKKGTYLQMYESFWDKDKKQPRTRNVKSFGYVEDLISDEIPDPIKFYSDYVKEQNGKNVQVYADGHITLLPQDKVGYMRYHTPYEQTDPVPGMTYTPTGDGDMLVAANRDHNGRYLEYTAEWIPQIADPTLITTFDLTKLTK